jgi:transcriptional regulator with GAF, ATPase, and Fis domain
MPTSAVWDSTDPKRCWLCGASQEESNPAKLGEPACRVCGCHVRATADPASIERTKVQIRNWVGELQEKAASNISRDAFGRFLVEMLCNCLAAKGAMYWRRSNGIWSEQTVLPTLEFLHGEADTPEFAARVIQQNQEQLQQREGDGNRALLIGVPLVKDNRVLGAFEIVQRPDTQPVTQRGYLRFLQQIVELAAQCQSLVS